MTESFMDALNDVQRDVLGAIACNQDSGHDPQTFRVLAERDLIVGYREELPGWPPVEVVRWEVPLPVHIQWAAWCANQPDEEDAT
jgi:hypothetical protein